MTYEEAEKLALKAIHDGGRGMIGAGRNHLHQRVARAILAARSEGAGTIGRGRAEAYMKEWRANGEDRSRVDRTTYCEPWLANLSPTITPLYAAPVSAPMDREEGIRGPHEPAALDLNGPSAGAVRPGRRETPWDQEAIARCIDAYVSRLVSAPDAEAQIAYDGAAASIMLLAQGRAK